MRTLMWFRSDLRCQDNLALAHATSQSDGGVVGLFLYCPQQWKQHDWGNPKVGFLHRNVQALSEALRAYNIPLVIRVCESFQDATVHVLEVAQSLSCQTVMFNKEYEINERRRDKVVTEALAQAGIAFQGFDDSVILEPGSVRKKDDTNYSVFTPYKKMWLQVLNLRGGPPSLAESQVQSVPVCDPSPLPDSIDGYDLSDDRADLWPAGEEQALERLEKFAAHRIHHYNDRRDIPSVNGTSTVSAYLALGVLSPRQCLSAAVRHANDSWPSLAMGKDGVSIWISELIWREFYRHLLVAYPRLSMDQPFQEKTKALVWRNNEEEFQAWCEGRTGYPIVDAAMQQLNQTGWMHNRLRMIVAMFLTKQLLVDWRWGERYFMQRLVDGDLAANNGGWQWSASTGTDAAPYFRIFNPWTQGKRFDPKGEFIKRLLPELAEVPHTALHDPVKLSSVKPASYPDPVCDHKEGRERALAAFKSL